MKANAPEKLYVNFHFIETHPESHQPLVTKQGINKYDIEYIRADAFMEKAKKWFEKQNEWRDINGIKHCDMGDFEDFKSYMKGE